MVAGFVGLLIVWGALAALLDAHGAWTPTNTRYDVIIVAGCRVDANGQPSLALQRRTRLAVDLWSQGRAPVVVFTGGVGTFPPSEARAAADYATQRGLPPDAAVLEERSTSTEENARFAAALLQDLGVPHAAALLVTDGYHTFRARRVFAQHFAQVDAMGSQPSWDVRTRGALREVFAVAWYGATGKLSARDNS